MKNTNPSVLILLATHNGQSWIAEQIRSILCQRDVQFTICVSDDHSTDNTLAEIKALIPDLYLLPAAPRPLGSACRNFLYLIESAEINDCEYVAFADQDDIWFEDKLAMAVSFLNQHHADGYSSNVWAFWPDGKRRFIYKSDPQCSGDFLFESAGPGCTFVMRRELFLALQDWVKRHIEYMQDQQAHDWLIYAFARHNGFKWLMDRRATMLYRQHDHNSTGVNLGWRAIWRRLKYVLSGQARLRVLSLARALDIKLPTIQKLERFRLCDRLGLLLKCNNFRRSGKDVWALRVLFLIMRRVPRADYPTASPPSSLVPPPSALTPTSSPVASSSPPACRLPAQTPRRNPPAPAP
jgi:rhamnosyltransferase